VRSTSKSFADHLFRSLGIDVVLALFAELDLPLRSGETSQFRLVDIVAVLKAALSVNE
jgi:hypothetical protein